MSLVVFSDEKVITTFVFLLFLRLTYYLVEMKMRQLQVHADS